MYIKQTYWPYLLSTVNQNSRVCISHPNPLNSIFNEIKDLIGYSQYTIVKHMFGPVLHFPIRKAISTDAGKMVCVRALLEKI